MSPQERKGTRNTWIGFSEDEADGRRRMIIAVTARGKPDAASALTRALRRTRSNLDHELARSVITSPNMRRLSRKKLTLLPSAWFQRTGTSRIRKPARPAR